MITIIGVGHVFAISDRVKEVIRDRRPEVVCLELDRSRYYALMNRDRSRPVPIQYRLLAYFQKRMARQFGTQVGEEMVAAAEAAGDVGAELALIDMEASRVFSELWRSMSFREKLRLLTGSVAGMLASKERVEKEIQRYEKHEEEFLAGLAEELPSVKRVLLDDRNRHMAERISSIASEHGSVVAVIGDGHVQGVIEALRPREVEALRLRDLRKPPAPERRDGTGFSVSYWYEQK